MTVDLGESAKAGLALGGYETPISGYEISYRYPILSVGFRYRFFLAMRFSSDSTGYRFEMHEPPAARGAAGCDTCIVRPAETGTHAVAGEAEDGRGVRGGCLGAM